jgi:polyisoprenoid-binding protein YceI
LTVKNSQAIKVTQPGETGGCCHYSRRQLKLAIIRLPNNTGINLSQSGSGTWIDLIIRKSLIMKTTTAIKKLSLLYFALFFFVSCSDAAEKISSAKTDDPGSKAKKNTAAKKDVPKWNVNAATAQIKFSVKGPFGTVDGSLGDLKATILFDKDNLAASSIRASTDPKSISTGIKLRNKDLQKEKYLDSDKYPLLSFQSDQIQKSGTGYKAIGNLSIKGISKKVEIPFSFSEKGNAGVFKGSFSIQRQDYGIGKQGGSIGSTVTINLDVPVTK